MLTQEQKSIIISKSAQGASSRRIAPLVGVSKDSVLRAQKELRPLIDKEAELLLTSGLKASRETTVRFAEYGASEKCIPGESDPAWAKISLDASKSIIGILSQGSNSTIINQLIQINQAPEQTKELSALAEFIRASWSQSDIDNEDVRISLVSTHTSDADPGVSSMDQDAGVIDVSSVDNPVDKSSTPQVAGNVYRGKLKKST